MKIDKSKRNLKIRIITKIKQKIQIFAQLSTRGATGAETDQREYNNLSYHLRLVNLFGYNVVLF